MNAQLKIGVPRISENLNHLEIHSVGEYVIFDDLLRPLVKINSNGDLIPDLADSWEIKDHYKKYIFTIRSNQHFSDNSLITTKEIVTSLQTLMMNSDIIHGDGKKIKKVTLLSDIQFEIELNESNPFFLEEISAPEYRIIKNNDAKYGVTSGPYFATNDSSPKNLRLKLNENYPFEANVKFKEVEYITYQGISKKELESLDIIWPVSTIGPSEIEKIKEYGYYVYKFNLGFSYWLSLNPNTLNSNIRFQIKKKLDSTLKDSTFFSNNNYSRSRQLFLPNGPGRLTNEEIDLINVKLEKKITCELKNIKILLPKNIQKELLLLLESSFDQLELHFYSDFFEYSKLIKQNQYDIGLVNNDFSSIDLRSSLVVTFNSSRQLVWTEKNGSDYPAILNSINTELNTVKRHAAIKRLGEKVLQDVIVYPLYYDYGFIFVKEGVDLSQLNKSTLETFSWKVR